ncbi:hypothetical protein CRM22_008736 [Opisthorchis felineus]|uniref:Uncharacterized protein n=1 Tax=Opisthorchis felineus TaxID=147828 RepID=A0A4S2LI55_OPIFE|nr:hypothetical protein CRM22_008736 [Opisthorchis felineus]
MPGFECSDKCSNCQHFQNSTNSPTIHPSISVPSVNRCRQYVSLRARIYFCCVILCAVVGLVLLIAASLIFYVRTGLMLTTGSKQTSLTPKAALSFLAVAKWVALVLLIVGGLLLVSGVILCYINRRMTPYGLRLSDTTLRPQMTRASVNLELPKVIINRLSM